MQEKHKTGLSGQILFLSSSVIPTAVTENKMSPSVGSLITTSLMHRNNSEMCLLCIKQKQSVVFCYYDISNLHFKSYNIGWEWWVLIYSYPAYSWNELSEISCINLLPLFKQQVTYSWTLPENYWSNLRYCVNSNHSRWVMMNKGWNRVREIFRSKKTVLILKGEKKKLACFGKRQ